jgi:uncharacterized membrane protein
LRRRRAWLSPTTDEQQVAEPDYDDAMTGPDPTERTQTQPPDTAAAGSPPPAAPPPASPPPAAPPPPSEPAWRPPRQDRGGGASVILGVIVLLIGLWFFATRTLGLDLPRLDWGQLWPIILIVLGGWIVFGALRRGR